VSIRSSRFLLLAASASLLAACNSAPIPVPSTTLSGVIVSQRAGEALAGATVSVEGSTVTATTDASGHYTLSVPNTTKNVVISKADYASTRVENIDASAPLVLDEILRPSFDPALPTTPPTVTTDLQDGAVVGGGDLNIQVTTTPASPDLNGPATGIASIGVDAGSSGYLNAGRARVALTALKSQDTFTFKAADFAGFNGNTDIHIDVYDHNGNRTHLIRHVKVNTAAVTGAVAAPTGLTPLAITFADTATFGPLSTSPQSSEWLKQWAKTGDTAKLKALAAQAWKSGTLNTQAITPQAAPAGTVMWVDVNFKYDPAAPAPRSFELYRSLDGGQTFSKVLTAQPSKVLVDATKPTSGQYVMRDNSGQLTPGVQATYKVRAVSDASGQDSATTSVTPLGRYVLTLGAPAQAATGVDTQPIFRWSTSGASDKEALVLLVLDRTQAEGRITQWQSEVSGKTSAIYNYDAAALTPYLQPFHAYDWQLAGATYNTDETAFSIGADFFNVLGLTANPVEGGPINEFVTGGY